MNFSDEEENPFAESLIKRFDPHQIVLDLTCGICQEIAVQASECIQCSTLYCKKCEEDWKKKQQATRCPHCNNSGWELKEPHKVYKNLLSRLQFKCPTPNCVELYTIDTFKYHEHKYLAENQIMFEYILKDKEGIGESLDQTLAKQFEIHYQAKQKFTHYITNKKYEMDFSDQKNLKGIDLVSKENVSFVRFDKHTPQLQRRYKWLWFDNDKNNWQKYQPENDSQIDTFYQKFVKNPQSNEKYFLKLNNIDYEIDFCNLNQIRVSTGFKRRIVRSEVQVNTKMRFSEN